MPGEGVGVLVRGNRELMYRREATLEPLEEQQALVIAEPSLEH